MKIIEIEYLGPPAVGGVEAVVETLSRKFIAAGHDTAVWCTTLAAFGGGQLPPGENEVNRLAVRRFPARQGRRFLFDPYHVRWQGLSPALQAEAGSAVFHLHPFPASHAMSALATLPRHGAVVITPHHEVESLRRYRKLWRGKRILGALLRAAKYYPSLCLGVHTILEADFWRQEMGWPPAQIRVIPNGVELAEFDGLSAETLAEAQRLWPPAANKLLFTGRLDPAKGLDLLLRALASLPDAGLLLVGPDAGAGEGLQQLCRELNLTDRVNFAGALPRPLVCGAFRACDIFVLPSRYGENFGIVAIEAMAAGKPVVVSDCGGLPTLVTPGENGLLFPAGETGALQASLAKLLAAPDMRTTLGAAGRKKVEAGYTWDKVSQSYLELFALADSHRRPAQSP
jgi:glycosyltransferase involved in cell wall biosynthesis